MKKLMLGVLVVIATGVFAASALATGNGNTVWLCNGEQIFGSGNSRCLVDAENEGAFVVEDMLVPAREECNGGSILDEGWVGPGSEAEITAIEFMNPATECKAPAKAHLLGTGEPEDINGCEDMEEVKVENLPWKGLLFLSGSLSFILVGPGTGGEPGYKIKCKIAGISKSDLCEVLSGVGRTLEALNLTGNAIELPLVSVEFPKNFKTEEEEGKCTTETGSEQNGLSFGFVLLEALEGSTQVSLEMSEE
jgi:hypothetical protein